VSCVLDGLTRTTGPLFCPGHGCWHGAQLPKARRGERGGDSGPAATHAGYRPGPTTGDGVEVAATRIADSATALAPASGAVEANTCVQTVPVANQTEEVSTCVR
jgi:hypothetical protein